MRKILFQVPSRPLGNDRILDCHNTTTEGWRALKNGLSTLGYNFTTADKNSLSDVAWVFFLTGESVENEYKNSTKYRIKKTLGLKTPDLWPERDILTEAERCGMSDKMVLLIMEGSVISPSSFNPIVWKKFKYVLTWNDDLIDNKKFFKIDHPSATSSPTKNNAPFEKRKFLVNIIANKTSSLPLELYTARRRSIEYFDTHHTEHFDLFGSYWNKPITKWEKRLPWLVKKYQSYRGTVEDKIEMLSRYKFAFCYENTAQNGYITEKLFDALYAKAVPIYLGAPNITDYVDPDVFIDRRKFKDDAELANYLFSMTKEKWEEYLVAGERYMKSDKFKKFLPESFAETIIRTLNIK